MIWAVLAILGVPLWLCAVGISVLVLRSRALSARPGNIQVRVLRPGASRWRRGHGLWLSDVFAWRASPAAWAEDLVLVSALRTRAVNPGEARALRRLGDDPVVVELTDAHGDTLTVAASADREETLAGPFSAPPATTAAPPTT